MTQDELESLLNRSLDAITDAHEVPDDTDAMLAEIARWMHIDQDGFARSDLVHMQLECQVLIDMLVSVRRSLADFARHAKDDDEP